MSDLDLDQEIDKVGYGYLDDDDVRMVEISREDIKALTLRHTEEVLERVRVAREPFDDGTGHLAYAVPIEVFDEALAALRGKTQ